MQVLFYLFLIRIFKNVMFKTIDYRSLREEILAFKTTSVIRMNMSMYEKLWLVFFD